MRVPGARRRPEGRSLPSGRSDPSCTKRRFQEEDEGPAMKLYISEDAVSACLQRLSLENDHNYGGNGLPRMSPVKESPDPERGSPDRSSGDESVIVDPGDFSMSSCKVMSVCPLLEENLKDPRPESIIPESLLRSLSSPCLDLVLWSPPSGPIHQLLRSLAGVEERSNEPTGRKSEADEGMMELEVVQMVGAMRPRPVLGGSTHCWVTEEQAEAERVSLTPFLGDLQNFQYMTAPVGPHQK